MKEPFLLWNCWTSLSNWCPGTTQGQFPYKVNANSTWSQAFPLPPDPLYPPVQIGSDTKNMGITGSFSFSTRNPQNRDFSELNRNPTMNAWVYLNNISSVTEEIFDIRRSSEFEVKRTFRDLALLIITRVPLGSSLACKMGTVSPSLPPKRVFCEDQFR